jgi:hypothetical protein
VTEEEFSIPLPEMLVEQLSPEGRELLEPMRRAEGNPEDVVREMLWLSPKDRAVLMQINGYLLRAYQFEQEPAQKDIAQADLALSVIDRARELDPSIGERTTLGEAVRVLQRYGEKMPEGLDLDGWIEVPGEE